MDFCDILVCHYPALGFLDSGFGSVEIKEYVLDHQEKSKVVRAYTNKSDYTQHLIPLMDFWSGFIVGLLEKWFFYSCKLKNINSFFVNF